MKFVAMIQIHWIERRLEDRFYAGNVEISFVGIKKKLCSFAMENSELLR